MTPEPSGSHLAIYLSINSRITLFQARAATTPKPLEERVMSCLTISIWMLFSSSFVVFFFAIFQIIAQLTFLLLFGKSAIIVSLYVSSTLHHHQQNPEKCWHHWGCQRSHRSCTTASVLWEEISNWCDGTRWTLWNSHWRKWIKSPAGRASCNGSGRASRSAGSGCSGSN